MGQRETYYLHVTERQMEILRSAVKLDRQRSVAAKEHLTGTELDKNNRRITALRGIDDALQKSVYFHNKRTNSPS